MTPIRKEWFETRVLRFLYEAKMKTLEEVADRPAWEWLRMPGCGRKTVRDIEEVLRDHGLSFRGGDYHPRDGHLTTLKLRMSDAEKTQKLRDDVAEWKREKIKLHISRMKNLERAIIHAMGALSRIAYLADISKDPTKHFELVGGEEGEIGDVVQVQIENIPARIRSDARWARRVLHEAFRVTHT